MVTASPQVWPTTRRISPAAHQALPVTMQDDIGNRLSCQQSSNKIFIHTKFAPARQTSTTDRLLIAGTFSVDFMAQPSVTILGEL
jgi:hypothetical protein